MSLLFFAYDLPHLILGLFRDFLHVALQSSVLCGFAEKLFLRLFADDEVVIYPASLHLITLAFTSSSVLKIADVTCY